MTLKTGDVLLNRYRVVRLVGQGGFGAVYRAWDTNVSQPVALKENLGVDAEAQRQFEREATMLAGLRHPNLPRVTDHFILPGQGQYLIMDFVEGKSLAALLAERGGPLPEADALGWAQQVCAALAYLHGRTPPIIHRDIKPENVIITADNQAMLVDFGISKIYVAGGQTTVGAMAVTPGYSPPEQYGGTGTDARSDVYALGATLFKLLTGQTPPDSVEIMAAEVTVPAVRDLNPAVSPAVSRAIERAMIPQMSRRTRSAAELAAGLKTGPDREPDATVAAPHPPAVPATAVAPLAAVNRAAAPPVAQPLAAPVAQPLAAPVAQPLAAPPAAAEPARRQRSDGGLATLVLLVVGVALSLAAHGAAKGLQGSYYDYRAVAAFIGLAYTLILLVGALGGPWLGALGGALVGVGLHQWLYYWDWPFAALPLLVGFLAGVRAQRGAMRSLFGAALSGLLLAALVSLGDLALRALLYGDTSYYPTEALFFLGGGAASGVLAWLLARALPRAWLRRLPMGNRLR